MRREDVFGSDAIHTCYADPRGPARIVGSRRGDTGHSGWTRLTNVASMSPKKKYPG
jgi:hypothetical protein